MPHRVHVFGAGGHAKVVIRTLQDAGFVIESVFDDDSRKWGTELFGVPIVGPIVQAREGARRPAVSAIGDNGRRRWVAEACDVEWLSVVHPAATVDRTVRIGRGVVVFANAVIQVDAVLGDHVIVNSSATIDHDCAVGRFAHVGPAACLTGGVRIDEGAFVGAGSVVAPRLQVGAWATVGAGAAVVRDVEAATVVMGVPARVRREASGSC